MKTHHAEGFFDVAGPEATSLCVIRTCGRRSCCCWTSSQCQIQYFSTKPTDSGTQCRSWKCSHSGWLVSLPASFSTLHHVLFIKYYNFINLTRGNFFEQLVHTRKKPKVTCRHINEQRKICQGAQWNKKKSLYIFTIPTTFKYTK